jgi:hypothetical protein
MNYQLMGQMAIAAVLVQAVRYLLFEQETVSGLWKRFYGVPLLGTFLRCAFCQGFWLGFFAFWLLIDPLRGVIWGLMSAWIAATWDRFTKSRKEAIEENDDEPKRRSKASLAPLLNECPESGSDEQIAMLECNIDDMSGEFFADLLDRLLAAGAVDVWFTPAYGKKNRPLYQLSALVPFDDEANCIHVILEHSSTAGIRRRFVQRVVMERSFVQVKVQGEPIAVKRLEYQDIVKFSPEWDDCAAAARKLGLSAAEIYAEAQHMARTMKA